MTDAATCDRNSLARNRVKKSRKWTRNAQSYTLVVTLNDDKGNVVEATVVRSDSAKSRSVTTVSYQRQPSACRE